ncbi:hypothetical protein ACJX0J_004014 [Zea mays]
MLSIACVDQFLVAFSLVDSYFIVWRNGSFIFLWNKKNSSILFLFCNIILNQTDMYISKRFSSEVKSTKVTQKMDKIVSVTNKNIYRESLLTSSKLEFRKKNEYQADGLNYTRNPGFKEKRYGLDCIEPWIGAETQWKLIIVNLFQSNIDPILHVNTDNNEISSKRKIRRLYKVDIIKTTPPHFLILNGILIDFLAQERAED